MADSAQAGTFHFFPLLPKELRLQIWGATLTPRVIPLHRFNDTVKGRGILYPMRIATVGFMALTTSHPSLEIIRRVCPEANAVCQRRFVDLEIWDVRKMSFGTPYDPSRDVLFFSHSIDAVILLDFVRKHPMPASRLETLGLPGHITSERVSRREILAALHSFDRLREVIIVMGNASKSRDNLKWLGGIEKEHWTLPHSAEETLKLLKNERWPDWKIPIVTVVRSQEDILSKKSVTIWIE